MDCADRTESSKMLVDFARYVPHTTLLDTACNFEREVISTITQITSQLFSWDIDPEYDYVLKCRVKKVWTYCKSEKIAIAVVNAFSGQGYYAEQFSTDKVSVRYILPENETSPCQ